jgi:hypothetical protein
MNLAHRRLIKDLPSLFFTTRNIGIDTRDTE